MTSHFQPNRRHVLAGATGLIGLALTPEQAAAAAALAIAADWKIAFADLEGDLAPRPLQRVHGKAPAGLAGTLYRNGGAKFRRTKGQATHWFDGDGLIRAFRIQEGGASLAARFVDTPKRRADTAADGVISGGFGTRSGPGARIASPDDVNAANISVIRRGDKLWALWEAGSPFEIDPASLATTGMVTGTTDEYRDTHLVFTFASPADELIVEGVATYPGANSVLKPATTVNRAVIGGSGAYAGATGWCDSTHNADGTWTHVFHIH